MTISPDEPKVPGQSQPVDDPCPARGGRRGAEYCKRIFMCALTDRSWLLGLFRSWSITARVASLVVVTLTMIIFGLWLLRAEITVGPLRMEH